jgi:hypothetical protein
MIGDFRHQKRPKQARWDSNLYRGAVRTRGLAIEEDIRPNTATHHLVRTHTYAHIQILDRFRLNRAVSFDITRL